MKLLNKTKDSYDFHLASGEKALLLQVLHLYPRIPAAYQRVSKGDADESKQRLLDEALMETRIENKQQLQKVLSDPKRLVQDEEHWVLRLSESDLEWLLQILNDIRVGSWIMLGSPESLVEAPTVPNAPHFWALEMADYFQSRHYWKRSKRKRARGATQSACEELYSGLASGAVVSRTRVGQ